MTAGNPAKQPLPATGEPGSPGLTEARELGARDAELFDLKLRDRETRHVLGLLARPTASGLRPDGFHRQQSAPDAAASMRHRDLLRHHLRFCRALESSRPWRVVRRLGPGRWRPPIETLLTDAEVDNLDGSALDATLETVSAFVRRVLESSAWRLIQAARSSVGRKW